MRRDIGILTDIPVFLRRTVWPLKSDPGMRKRLLNGYRFRGYVNPTSLAQYI